MTNTEQTSVPQATIDAIKAMSQDDAVATLKTVLRAAVKLEMATIPIYLYTYYSICRKPGRDNPPTGVTIAPTDADAFPAKPSLYGNLAGATVMSVAVEEMLHMSLAMNLLTSTLTPGEDLPQIYDGLTFGDNGIVLPALSTLSATTGGSPTAPIENVTGDPLEIPLAKLSLDQLQHFMRIEYPGKKDSKSPASDPTVPNWATIGEVYDYAKALIQYGSDCGGILPDSVFSYAGANQIGSDNYSASNIDTVSSGDQTFTFDNPPVVGTDTPTETSASVVAVFANDDNHDHEGEDALFRISTATQAISAINTICEQGEGADFTQFVQDNELEESHYYKFWSLCAELEGYPAQMQTPPQVAGIAGPPASANQITDLGERFVYDFPTNPKVASYNDPRSQALANVANGLFQYMLIMTETTLLVPDPQQKLYFNKTMHQSMIWVMDKLYQAVRYTRDSNGMFVVPTFENPFPTGTTREFAFSELKLLVEQCKKLCAGWSEFEADATYYMAPIENLPDVSAFWDGDTGKTPNPLPPFVDAPTPPTVIPDPAKAGTAAAAHKVTKAGSPYEGITAFPSSPPTDAALTAAAGANNWVRHGCMTLNSCKNQGRTLNNNCAGQGWCATSLAYNAAKPSEPSVSDHQCHVTNNCKGQGGCGLYGTQEELNIPGGNSCQAQGSCATPINAERFTTEGENRRTSVWKLARAHFQNAVASDLKAFQDAGSEQAADADSPLSNPLFASGPTIEWMEDSNDGNGMTACGSSGMSGAGSCA